MQFTRQPGNRVATGGPVESIDRALAELAGFLGGRWVWPVERVEIVRRPAGFFATVTFDPGRLDRPPFPVGVAATSADLHGLWADEPAVGPI